MSKPKIARPRKGVNRSTSNDTPAAPAPSRIETPEIAPEPARDTGKSSIDALQHAMHEASGWSEALALTLADLAFDVAETDAERSATESIMEGLQQVSLLRRELRDAREALWKVDRVVLASLLNVIAKQDARLAEAGVVSC